MLRGLVMRQGFMIAESILGLVIIGIAVFAIRDLYAPQASYGSGDRVASSDSGTLTLLKPVDSRATYQSIVASKIFGKAASYIHNAPKPPKKVVQKPQEPIVTDSKLPLTLKGTLYAGENSKFSSANILVSEKGMGMKTFFIGSEIIDRVFLLKVSKNEVLLDNKRANRQEILKHELDLETGAKKSAKAGEGIRAPRKEALVRPASSGRPTQQKLVTLDRKTIIKKLEDEYERLASTVDVLEVKDDDGNLLGISTPDIESIGVMNELGFRNGDILVSVNNEKVTGQDQMSALANKYRNSTVVRVGILRDGKLMNFTYRLR